jgi:hypothetical protein
MATFQYVIFSIFDSAVVLAGFLNNANSMSYAYRYVLDQTRSAYNMISNSDSQKPV